MKRIVKWLPVAGMGLLWAGAALASTTGAAGIDVPANAGINMVQNGLAPAVGMLGGVGVVHSIHSGHWGEMAGRAAITLVAAAGLHNYSNLAPYFGGAAAATIQLAHHAVRLIA